MQKENGGLGFCHLYGFNLFMLGKQGWKLLADHDAIVSKVLKAIYYPKGDFLQDSLGANPSYTWCNIYAS